MNRTQTALKIRGQIDKFMGVFSPHFSKPKQRFIRDMLFGIQAAKDVKLSSIARALDEPISPKKIEDRLSRNLDTPGLGDVISEQIARSAARRIKQDTLIIVDPTDIRKQYARKMPFLGRVRDGSTGQLVNGYWGCLAVACEVGKRKMIPLHQRLWSTAAPHTVSENHQLLGIIQTIRGAVGQRGIYVMDRGGDRCRLYNPLMKSGLRFMIRLTGKRDLMVRGRKRNSLELAESCPMRYSDQIVRETQEGEKTCQINYGFRRVKLPGRKQQLYLVVVKGFGKTPLMILTNVAVNKTRKSLWFIVEGYLSRWLIEDVRLLSYCRLQKYDGPSASGGILLFRMARRLPPTVCLVLARHQSGQTLLRAHGVLLLRIGRWHRCSTGSNPCVSNRETKQPSKHRSTDPSRLHLKKWGKSNKAT